MSAAPVPLSVLDLSAFGSGSTPADGLRESLDLAREAERRGYARFWLAEHHLNPGVAGAAPHVLAAAVAAATARIRVGTAVTVLGNTTPLRVAEEIGLLSALHPGRIDLGIGRSGSRTPSSADPGEAVGPGVGRNPASHGASRPTPPERPAVADREVAGLLLPAPPPPRTPGGAHRAVHEKLLSRTRTGTDTFTEDVHDILALLDGTYRDPDGASVLASPATGSDAEVWIHGSSAGPSARRAGELGLPFGANYHVVPSFVTDAIAAYREAFRPGRIAAPHVIVSADVLVADTDARARELAAGYGQWVHSIRAGRGAIPYPTPAEALAAPLRPEEEAVVRDRLVTRFVGSPETVSARLDTLVAATGADELLVTTLAHDPADRRRSLALLAESRGILPG